MAEATQSEKPQQIPQKLAAAILERAAQLDANTDDGIAIAHLKDAAREAGIGDQAFERAVAEATRESETSKRASGHRSVAPLPRAFAYKAAASGAVSGALGFGIVSLFSAPPADAIGGALVGSAAVIVGVLAYLNTAVRSRSSAEAGTHETQSPRDVDLASDSAGSGD